jgi:hypothetical protein
MTTHRRDTVARRLEIPAEHFPAADFLSEGFRPKLPLLALNRVLGKPSMNPLKLRIVSDELGLAFTSSSKTLCQRSRKRSLSVPLLP